MKDPIIQQDAIRAQYRDSSNLGARMTVHERFSTNKTGWFQFVMDRLLSLSENARILEIGGGPAALWASQPARILPAWRVNLSDYSPGMVRQARERLSGKGQYTFTVLDAQAVPFATGTFDAIIANHMLYHVADCDRAIREIRRVLKPGGIFLAATNGSSHMKELHDLIIQFDSAAKDMLGCFLREFNLENGAEQISRHFQQVRLERYRDSLRVTEAQPLVDYIFSMSSLYHSTALRQPGTTQAMYAAIDEQIQKSGAFIVQKDTGLFIAQ